MWVVDIQFWAPAARLPESERYRAWHKAVDQWIDRQVAAQGGDDEGYAPFDPGPWKLDEARAALKRGERW